MSVTKVIRISIDWNIFTASRSIVAGPVNLAVIWTCPPIECASATAASIASEKVASAGDPAILNGIAKVLPSGDLKDSIELRLPDVG